MSCISRPRYFTIQCLFTYASASRLAPLGSSYSPIAHSQGGHLVCLHRCRHLDRRYSLLEPKSMGGVRNADGSREDVGALVMLDRSSSHLSPIQSHQRRP